MTAGSAALRCACGNVLGIFADGQFTSRHHGRTVEAVLVLRVTCEGCGRTTALNTPLPESAQPPNPPAERPRPA
jgi:hypothetical protein